MTDEDQEALAPEETESSTETEQPEKAKAPEGEQSGTDSPETEKPKKNAFQERINELTRRAKEAEQSARESAERAETYRQQLDGKATDLKRPTLESCDYDQDRYEAEMAEYISSLNQRSYQKARADEERQIADQRRQAANLAAQETFRARMEVFKDDHPDFEQVVNGSVALSQAGEAVQQAVLLADNGPALAYHLAKNPETIMELRMMPPGMAMMRLGQITERLAKSLSVKTSNAPAPSAPVKPTGKIDKRPEDMSTEEYVRFRNKQRGLA